MAAVHPSSRAVTSHWRWALWSLVLGVCLLVLPFRVVGVVGHSMEPTLHDGQRVLVDRAYYRLTGLFRYDLVVLRRGDENWIKRLIGLPGDRLALVADPDGTIKRVLNLTLNPAAPLPSGIRIILVPSGYLYIVGDNMAVSKDSRMVGPLPAAELLGVVRTPTMARVFPLPRGD